MAKRGTDLTGLQDRARKGFRGYPVATMAFYGSNDTRASKVAVGIVLREGGQAEELARWYSDETDVRNDPTIGRAIVQFIGAHDVKTVVMTDRVIGCPHEEGIDYPEGATCPKCPFWANRDRWTGEPIA